MKNRSFVIASFLLAAMVGSAQQLTCSQQNVDCGETAYGASVTATFELRNTGARNVRIDDVRADCGCTKVKVEKKRLAAGETTTVIMTYDGRTLGHFAKQAAVSYHEEQQGEPAQLEIWLMMKGVVKGELKDYSGSFPYKMGDLLTDKQTLEFDDVSRGEHPEQEINILNNSQKIMIPNMEHLPRYLTAVVTPERLKPGEVGRISVMLNTELLDDYGLTQTTVYLAGQLGENISEETALDVSAVLLPDLKTFNGRNKQYAPKMKLSAHTIELQTTGAGQRKKTEITISNKGRTPLEISSLQMFTGGLQLTLEKRTLQPQEETKLRVKADINELRKARTKPRILMITNDPEHSKLVIPIIIKK